MDLFWIYEDKIIIDCLIHVMKLKKKVLLEMCMEEMHIFIKNDIIKNCIKDYSLEKSLPFHNSLLQEKEIIID